MNQEKRKSVYALAAFLDWCDGHVKEDPDYGIVREHVAKLLDRAIQGESKETLTGIVRQLSNLYIEVGIKRVVNQPELRVVSMADIRALASLDPVACVACELDDKAARTCHARKLMQRLLIPEDDVTACGYRLY